MHHQRQKSITSWSLLEECMKTNLNRIMDGIWLIRAHENSNLLRFDSPYESIVLYLAL